LSQNTPIDEKGPSLPIYINVSTKQFSLGPVFEIRYLKDICKNYLKMDIDLKQIDK